jgi:hypothetical protein
LKKLFRTTLKGADMKPQVAVVGLLTVILWTTFSFAAQTQPRYPVDPKTNWAVGAKPKPADELKKELDAGKILIIDVRTPMEYEEFLRERRRRMADIIRVAFRQLGGEPVVGVIGGAPDDRDRRGQWCKVKANLDQIITRIREGKLSGQAEASQRPQGQFLPLKKLRPFQETLATKALTKTKTKRRKNGPILKEPLPAPIAAVASEPAILPPGQRGWMIVCLTVSLAILAGIMTWLFYFRPD